ncbi:hypothetical protein ACWD4K_27945 [Streptomyces gelaticus]
MTAVAATPAAASTPTTTAARATALGGTSGRRASAVRAVPTLRIGR